MHALRAVPGVHGAADWDAHAQHHERHGRPARSAVRALALAVPKHEMLLNHAGASLKCSCTVDGIMDPNGS